MEIVAGCGAKNVHKMKNERDSKKRGSSVEGGRGESIHSHRLIKSIKIESHLKRCYNAHNRNVQICQARGASERAGRRVRQQDS